MYLNVPQATLRKQIKPSTAHSHPPWVRKTTQSSTRNAKAFPQAGGTQVYKDS